MLLPSELLLIDHNYARSQARSADPLSRGSCRRTQQTRGGRRVCAVLGELLVSGVLFSLTRLCDPHRCAIAHKPRPMISTDFTCAQPVICNASCSVPTHIGVPTALASQLAIFASGREHGPIYRVPYVYSSEAHYHCPGVLLSSRTACLKRQGLGFTQAQGAVVEASEAPGARGSACNTGRGTTTPVEIRLTSARS